MRLCVHHDKPVIGGSVLLAVLVRANTFFSLIIFFSIAWAFFSDRLANENMDEIERAWYSAVISIFTATELVRLYFGYNGNVGQSVAQLFGFVGLTCSIHLGLTVIYYLFVPHRNSLDYGISVVSLIFAAFELFSGMIALVHFIRRNTIDFYVHLGIEV